MNHLYFEEIVVLKITLLCYVMDNVIWVISCEIELGFSASLTVHLILDIELITDQVFQRIDIFSKDFDNIVELELGAPWPLPPVEVTATLAHKFELIG